jgi:hypothetical protein
MSLGTPGRELSFQSIFPGTATSTITGAAEAGKAGAARTESDFSSVFSAGLVFVETEYSTDARSGASISGAEVEYTAGQEARRYKASKANFSAGSGPVTTGN